MNTENIEWLKTIIPKYFGSAEFEIDPFDDGMLGLIIYGDFSTSEFRKQRHALCNEIESCGYTELYNKIGIFQRHKK